MTDNDFIAQKPLRKVFLMRAPDLYTTNLGPMLLLTPAVFITTGYISTFKLEYIHNRLEIKLDLPTTKKLAEHVNANTLGPLKFTPYYNHLYNMYKFLQVCIAELESGSVEHLYISIPLISKHTVSTNKNIIVSNYIIQFHRILFESLVFATCVNENNVSGSNAPVPEPLTQCPMFFQLPEFTVVLNNEIKTPCDLCPQTKGITKDKKSCIFYTAGYECMFAADIPIMGPEFQVSKLAATLAMLDESDLKLINEFPLTQDFEKAWLEVNPEYAGIRDDDGGSH